MSVISNRNTLNDILDALEEDLKARKTVNTHFGKADTRKGAEIWGITGFNGQQTIQVAFKDRSIREHNEMCGGDIVLFHISIENGHYKVYSEDEYEKKCETDYEKREELYSCGTFFHINSSQKGAFISAHSDFDNEEVTFYPFIRSGDKVLKVNDFKTMPTEEFLKAYRLPETADEIKIADTEKSKRLGCIIRITERRDDT